MKRKNNLRKGDRMVNPFDGSRRRTSQVHKSKKKYTRKFKHSNQNEQTQL